MVNQKVLLSPIPLLKDSLKIVFLFLILVRLLS